jgi:hypothetical protein
LAGAKSAEAADKGALPHVMNIADYLNEIRALSASGQATEHSYRPALERLFKSIDPELTVINEPRRLTDSASNPNSIRVLFYTCFNRDFGLCA